MARWHGRSYVRMDNGREAADEELTSAVDSDLCA